MNQNREWKRKKQSLHRNTMFAYTLKHGEGEQGDKPQWIWHHQGPNALWGRDLRSVGIHHVLTGVHHCVTSILQWGADGAVNSCTNRKSLHETFCVQNWGKEVEICNTDAKGTQTTARQTETLTGLSHHFKLETQIWQTSCYLPIFASREAMACWSAPANTSLSWLVIGTHSVCTRIRRSPANSTVLLSINLSWTKNKHPLTKKKEKKTHRRLMIIHLMDHSGN